MTTLAHDGLTDEELAELAAAVDAGRWQRFDPATVARLITTICAHRVQVEAAAALHRRTFLPASRGEHSGRPFCQTCTTSVDDFTAYVDWPCPTARALGLAE